MNNQEITLAWERAHRQAERIQEAYYTGIGVEQARKDQKSLRHWLAMVAEYGIVYNGCYDEIAALVL